MRLPATDTDVIDALVGVAPGSPLDAIRARRPEARLHAQATYRALFAPAAPGNLTAQERFAAGAFVSGLHGDAAIAAFYAGRLADSGASTALREAVDAAIADARGHGPYGSYPPGPLTREDVAGPVHRVGAATRRALGAHLAAAFEHAHLLLFHPRDAAPGALQALLDAGWSTTDVVTLSQIVAFLSFQIRVVAGLRVLADMGGLAAGPPTPPTLAAPRETRGAPRNTVTDSQPAAPDTRGPHVPETVLAPPAHTAPLAFTRAQLEWLPWLEPLAAEAMTERQVASLVDAARVKSPYFRLLARDPDALLARTRTDKDIFYNPDAGLPRAERELAAAATSRFNGCLYCASVHARHAATYSKREADVQRLLDEGVTADLGERWNAIVAASVALAATPIAFGPEHVDRLRRSGLDDLAIADVIHAAAFFNWANRLMLSLGEPSAAPGA